MRRYGLGDDQWVRIKDFLPGREGHVGGRAEDNRLFVEAVLYRFRTGCPWRDLPERFGDWKTVHQRFSRWAKSGVFEQGVGFGDQHLSQHSAGAFTSDFRQGIVDGLGLTERNDSDISRHGVSKTYLDQAGADSPFGDHPMSLLKCVLITA
jgi:Putative transposase of IS4/5 family (DUF4096)